MSPCACESGLAFVQCCGPILAGMAAPTAEALMRSRYTAHVERNLEYIEKTCAGEALKRFSRDDLAQSLQQTRWLGLFILNTEAGQAGDTLGFVTFRVRFREGGLLYGQTERSEFRKVDGQWRYCNGTFPGEPEVISIAGLGRNDPCPCGSGKKFKKCCGA